MAGNRANGATGKTTRAALAFGLSIALATQAFAAGSLKLPLTAPEGVSKTLADYLEICSTGMTNIPAAGSLALKRGWMSMDPNGGGLAAGVAAAAGLFSATKDDGSFLTISRVQFPHVAASSCQMVLAAKPGDLGTDKLSEIEGIEGGGGVVGMTQKGAGFWSFVDDQGQVVTMTAIPAGGSGRFVLNMGRAELTELGKKSGAKPAG
ncbi:hypothetical protein [Aurantimonas sp. VKM B-3413]|uniref:hypothetical protein n=1 Tax=Aurantimonas sp. VKM B-3413 TaxID=2779401 RepID=UPI001E3DD2B2|nr:hypothetical protein [Aurantimonas sp. VKM B-3413]MCB8840596.1 hypothetical protein [Aurantimonas sp. VKM B-3413]